ATTELQGRGLHRAHRSSVDEIPDYRGGAMIRQRLLAAASTLFVTAIALAQQQLPTLEKGIQPEKLYQFHDIDSVNIFNGNLIITLPIGLSCPLNGGATYNFVLSYNSNVWDLEPG